MNKYRERIILLLMAGYALFLAAHLFDHPQLYQWDFRMTYQCAKAFHSGVNPYDTQAVAQMAGEQLLPFVYPPLTLFAFLPFTHFEYVSAYSWYLCFKGIALAGLIYLWSVVFLRRPTDCLFYALCLFAFNATIFVDLQSGNISLFEQCGLWLAFWFYMRRRFGLFCGFIVATALLKIQPIVFLCLLLVAPDRRKWRHLVVSSAAFGGVLALQYALAPALFRGFIANAGHTIAEQGIKNPSMFSLMRELAAVCAESLDVPLLAKLYPVAHCVIALFIVGMSWRAMRTLREASVPDREVWLLGLACCVFALISLRFKDYSYVVLILPAYFIFVHAVIDKKVLLVMLASLSATRVTLPGLVEAAPFWWNYYPLLIAFGVWWLYIRTIRSLNQRLLAQPRGAVDRGSSR